jgi:hypothetical protein
MPDSIIKADNISSLSGGGVGFPDGSVSNPSIKFTNDSDTGLYRIDANKIGISTGGVKVGEIGNGYGGFTGSIIQVSYSYSVTTVTTSTTATILSVTYTPKSNNSRLILMANGSSAANGSAGNNQTQLSIRENTTTLTLTQALTVQNAGAYPQRIPMSISVDISNTSTSSRSFNTLLSAGSADTVSISNNSLYIYEVLIS